MPTPDRTSLDEIVAAACDLLETEGLPGLTMQAVAQRVGVRAPSLYKRVESRDQLIRLVAEATLKEFASRLGASAGFVEIANTFRSLGLARPVAFQLIMMPGSGIAIADSQFGAAAVAPILRVAEELAGEDQALEAARTLTAWAAGFISMELNGGFRLGGNVDDAWEFGLATLIEAVSVRRDARPASPASSAR